MKDDILEITLLKLETLRYTIQIKPKKSEKPYMNEEFYSEKLDDCYLLKKKSDYGATCTLFGATSFLEKIDKRLYDEAKKSLDKSRESFSKLYKKVVIMDKTEMGKIEQTTLEIK